MASIDTGGGKGRGVNHELPLVPFIDLLFCCVMFLLATAVWNSLGTVNARAPQGPGGEDAPSDSERISLYLMVHSDGYTIATNVGERVEIPGAESTDVLAQRLQARRVLEPQRQDIVLIAEDDVHYDHLMQTMDMAVGHGFVDLQFQDRLSQM